jgi:ataxia telangiectasia mutated family protein
MTYHVLHGLFAAVYASPVVNEQIRLVNALSVWTALRCEDFDDPTLLHTLVQGSTALLAEYDLARAAQSILEWAFYLYRKLKLKDSAFSNVIIRICSIAYDYARSPYPDFQQLGNVLMDWMDKQAIVLSRSAVQIQVIRALPTWPYVPVPELAQIAAEQSSEGLEALLDDSRITYNKFRLVRRLYDHIAQGGRLKGRFSKHDFWRLKDCIPAQTELQQDDADAFASLLILGHGDISGITRDYQSHRSILTRYRPSKRKVNFNDPNVNNEIIIYSLLQLLDSHSPRSVFSAYETLRQIMAVLDNFTVPSGPSDYNSELEHLRAFPRRARTRPPCKLDEVVAPDTLLELTADFSRWISILSSRLSDFLARYNPIYGQLSSVLLANADFAADLLPVLVHAVLRTEIQKDKYVSKDHRRILTEYFTSVLSFEEASTTCRQSVIDIVLHLREFLPQKEVALSYNEWLDLDYMLLAKNAVSCGAYTTALLFLELSVDHPPANPQKTSKQEDLLYEIYSHIDEPDGFYGIKASNLQQFLIRRFHHEKQWDKALQFHGATVEADPNHFAGSDGLLQAFSSFGFNHLVMKTLHTPGSGSSALDYRLGWRTETWDLPDSKEFITGSSLYSSLRALYRERNPHIIDSITQRAISRTMDRLRSLGSENMTEIRETVQELMCLKEVKDWRDDSTQLKFRDRSIKADDWSNFFDIDTHFE